MKTEANPPARAAGQFPSGEPIATPYSPLAGPAALALVAALLHALRDRGVLSVDDLDEIVADAEHRAGYGGASLLIESMRRELARRDDE